MLLDWFIFLAEKLIRSIVIMIINVQFHKKWGISWVTRQILTNYGGLLQTTSYFLTFIFSLLILFLFFVFMAQELKPFATFHIFYLLGLVSLNICSLFLILWKRFPCPDTCHLFFIAKLILAAVILTLQYLINTTKLKQ